MARVHYPLPVEELIGELKRLPGVGARSAERMALWLLQHPRGNPLQMAGALRDAVESVVSCPCCGFFATREKCDLCDDGGRDEGQICVVEQAADILPLERAGVFRGRYHCLGGKLSPLDHVGPEDLRIGPLLERVARHEGRLEVILALGADVEGEATAYYLAERLREFSCSLSRIAQGLPAGGGLVHADDLTLLRALEGRRRVE